MVRGLRAIPEGGVALLTVDGFAPTSLIAWDEKGESRFRLKFLLRTPRFVVDGDGDFLVAGDSMRLLRLNRRGLLVKESVTGAVPAANLGGMELGPDGRLYLAGYTDGLMSASPGAYQSESRAGQCQAGGKLPASRRCGSGWLGSFDANSFQPLALSYLGGADENWLTGLAIDRSGSPLVVGFADHRIVGREPFPRTEGAVVPLPRDRTGRVMTISRLSPNLEQLVDSTWLAGSDEGIALAVEVNEFGRVLVTGSTNSPNFPATRGTESVCGPRRPPGNSAWWSVGARLSPSFSEVEQVVHFGETLVPGLVAFDTRAACVFNSGSFQMSREMATGQEATLVGGPFLDEDTLHLRGVEAKILYRSPTQINFVLPREAGTGENLALELSGRVVQRLDVKAARPTWIWNVREDGTLPNRGNFLINARRADGTLNADDNGFRPGEEVRAYATGIDLAQPLRLFNSFYDKEILEFTAS